MTEKDKDRITRLNFIIFGLGSFFIILLICILTVWVAKPFWSPVENVEDDGALIETEQNILPTDKDIKVLDPASNNGMVTEETPTSMPISDIQPGSISGKIVYTCTINGYNQVCVMNADGSAQRQLTPDDQPNSYYASLSRDGSQTLFASNRSGQFEIYKMNVDGGNLLRLTYGIGETSAPDLSPDGQKIVFTNKVNGKKLVWLMNEDGSDPHPITDTPGSHIDPIWSPDGTRVAFASNRTGAMALYVMNKDGSDMHLVTDIEGIGGRSSWSPDGQSLVFYAGPWADKDIYIVDFISKELLKLTDGGNNAGPCFSPNGEWIIFSSSRSGDHEIYIIKKDGSRLMQLTDNLTDDWQPRWGN